MNAGDADIVEVFNLVAHHFGGDDGLFGDRDVAGSGGNYSDNALAIFRGIALQNDCPGEVAIFGSADFFLYRRKLFFADARGQDVAAMLGQAGENSRDLYRSLAFTEDDLGHAGTQSAMMIDFGEAEVFEWEMPQARDGVVGRELALA